MKTSKRFLPVFIAGLLGFALLTVANNGPAEARTRSGVGPKLCEVDKDCPEGQVCVEGVCVKKDAAGPPTPTGGWRFFAPEKQVQDAKPPVIEGGGQDFQSIIEELYQQVQLLRLMIGAEGPDLIYNEGCPAGKVCPHGCDCARDITTGQPQLPCICRRGPSTTIGDRPIRILE